MSNWPSRAVPNFTDDELATAIERHESDPDPVTQQITRAASASGSAATVLPPTATGPHAAVTPSRGSTHEAQHPRPRTVRR